MARPRPGRPLPYRILFVSRGPFGRLVGASVRPVGRAGLACLAGSGVTVPKSRSSEVQCRSRWVRDVLALSSRAHRCPVVDRDRSELEGQR